MTQSDSPPYSYVAFIDEAGDPGLKRVRPLDPEGSSEWLMVAGVVIRAEHEVHLRPWIQELHESLGNHQMRDLHFAKLSPTRKLAVCTYVAGLPVRCFVVCSNKQNMKGHRNPLAEQIPSDNWFYCWMTRLLLERVTHFVRNKGIADGGGERLLKLVFSERGGLSYSQMNAYFDWLRAKGDNQVLKWGNLAYETFDRRLMEIRNHAGHDGLKLPDIVASAFFKGADVHNTLDCDPRFALALKDRMARWPMNSSGQIAGYGVKLMPTWKKLNCQPEQLKIFKDYGYPQQWWAD
jgi:hypothetical protein